MKIELPPETWVDVLQGRVSRERVAQLANQTTDRQFAEFAQAWLHRFDRNVQLRNFVLAADYTQTANGTLSKHSLILTIHQQTNNDGLPVSYVVRMLIPEVPLPNNITGFGLIDIKFLDNTHLEFLQKLQHIFTNINVYIDFRSPHTIMEALPHLFPLFHGIHSITLDENYSYDYFLFNHYPATMRKARVLNYSGWFASHGPTGAVFLLERFYFWLCDRRDDGEPRLLAMDLSRGEQCVLQEIRQRFLASKSTSRACFFVRITYFGLAVPQETITNWTTRERLEVCTNREEDDDNDEEEEAEVDQGLQSRTLLISRSPVAEIPDWLEQRRRWATGWEEPSVNAIRIHPALCDVREEQQQQQQPGTSNQQPATSTGNGGGTEV